MQLNALEKPIISINPAQYLVPDLMEGRSGSMIVSCQVFDSVGPTASCEYSDLLLPSGISARSDSDARFTTLAIVSLLPLGIIPGAALLQPVPH
jgi:hypothetical protein